MLDCLEGNSKYMELISFVQAQSPTGRQELRSASEAKCAFHHFMSYEQPILRLGDSHFPFYGKTTENEDCFSCAFHSEHVFVGHNTCFAFV